MTTTATKRKLSGSAIIFGLSVISCVLFSPSLIAHGGVSLEDDLCLMRIGNMRAHFTGYQPKRRASQEFCEDIPELGEAIIVLDFLDPPLRETALDFRVIKDTVGNGARTTFNDIQAQLLNPENIIFEVPAARYPSGSFSITMSFEEPGWYVGILRMNDDKSQPVVSVFPFSVGERDIGGILGWAVLIIGLSLLFFFLSAREKTFP